MIKIKGLMCTMLTLLVLILCVGCGNTNTTIQSSSSSSTNQNSDSDSNKNDNKEKAIKLGDEVSVSTNKGSFKIKIVDVAVATDNIWYGDSVDKKEQKVALLRCEVENIDYSEYDDPDLENYFNGYLLNDNGYLTVKDIDDFSCGFYDFGGPSDGKYMVCKDTKIGEKQRVCYPFLVPADENKLTIMINNEYKLEAEIE